MIKLLHFLNSMNFVFVGEGGKKTLTQTVVSETYEKEQLSEFGSIRIGAYSATAGGTITLDWGLYLKDWSVILQTETFGFGVGVALELKVPVKGEKVRVTVEKTSGVTTDPVEIYICFQHV